MIVPIFIDLETTIRGGPDGTSPEAHWLNNKVLLSGHNVNVTDVYDDTNTLADLIRHWMECDGGNEVLLVAHNAKFDIKYLMRNHPSIEWHKCHVWDTMTFEYRESGQEDQFMSLEAACAKRGIPFKKSLDLDALIKAGVKMEDIDKETLSTYLEGDVEAVRLLYEAQVATGFECNMDYILPLAEMELNGLKVDIPKAQQLMITLTKTTDKITENMQQLIKTLCEWQDGTPIIDEDFSDQLGVKSKYIKAMAARTSSFLIMGVPNTLQITPKWSVQFKRGYRAHYTSPPAALASITPNHLGYPMGEGILSQLSCPIAQEILDYRASNKLLSTYVGPFLHVAGVQGTIHPKLNTTATATSRLSSSGPNGQNVPPAARALITAEKGHDLMEIDFSQLEVVASACVTACSALQRAISNGEDIHYNSGQGVMGWHSPSDMTKETRTLVKNVNFGVIYGGKAGGLAKQTGVDKGKIQKLIDAFYKKYPGVARWQGNLFEEIVSNMVPYKIVGGEQTYQTKYTEPFSGHRYTFNEVPSPDWIRKKTGRGYSFSPNQIFNYPIQGFAGGGIVMYALHRLWVICRSNKVDCKFRMTVHDSILVEMPKGGNPIRLMQLACEQTEKYYNLPVKLSFDIKTGSTWQ